MRSLVLALDSRHLPSSRRRRFQLFYAVVVVVVAFVVVVVVVVVVFAVVFFEAGERFDRNQFASDDLTLLGRQRPLML